MPSLPAENPISAAHNHAANAEEHTNNGLIVLAMEEHTKAAEAFAAAIERSHDESAKRTLRMLYNEQLKESRELNRRIEKLREEGKDPSLPQPTTTSNIQPKNALIPHRAMTSSPQVPGRMESPQPVQRMTDTVDESFMLLGGQQSEPGDPFNQFWNIMQGMLDTLSSPVAFATAPLSSPIAANAPTSLQNGSAHSRTPPSSMSFKSSSFSGDPEVGEPILTRLGRRIGMTKETIPGMRHSHKSSQVDVSSEDDFDESLFDVGDDLSESFLVIPSGSETGALRKENTALKVEVANLQKRLEMAEKVLHLHEKQDRQLRDSIYQARREAQRVMGSSMQQRIGPDLANLNLNVTPPVSTPSTLPSSRENQYLQRIKELENDVRQARVENEKNQAMIRKYRERWDKLKESAKRKKEAKAAAAAAASLVRERIVEEPEAEEELDDT